MLAEIFGVDAVIVVVVAVLVLFGGSQIPKLARSLGSAQREFKHGLSADPAPAEGTRVADGAVRTEAAPEPTPSAPTR